MRHWIKAAVIALGVLGLMPIGALDVASAQTEEELYARTLTDRIADALASGDGEEVLALVSSYRQLGISEPASLSIAEGNAYILLEELSKAATAFERALSKPDLSNFERVKTEDLLRQLKKVAAAEQAQSEKRQQQIDTLIRRARNDLHEILKTVSVEDIVGIFESASSEQREQIWSDAQTRDFEADYPRLYDQDWSSGEGMDAQPLMYWMQYRILCDGTEQQIDRFAKAMFLGGDIQRLGVWLYDPLILPETCWANWSTLLHASNVGLGHNFSGRAKPIGTVYSKYDEYDQVNGPISYSPAAFMFADYIIAQGYDLEVKINRRIQFEWREAFWERDLYWRNGDYKFRKTANSNSGNVMIERPGDLSLYLLSTTARQNHHSFMTGEGGDVESISAEYEDS